MQTPLGSACSKAIRSFGPHSIRWRFIVFISLAFICALCVTVLWTTNQIGREAGFVAIEKVKADLQLAEALLDSRYPGDWTNQNGTLYKGNIPINEDFHFIDEVSKLTGDTCSIFLGDTRVATNVMLDSKRAVGTKVSPEVAHVVLEAGQNYLGEANVVGIKYQTAYKPLRDNTGKIIGIWYVGANKNFVDTMIAHTVHQVALAFLIGWLLIISVAWLLTSSLIKSVDALINAANRLAAGDLDTGITSSSRHEIGYLAQAFDQMREKLRLNNQNMEMLVNERTAELKLAYAELKQLDETKSNFLSTVSHELRTPLTSILGFAQLIQRKLENIIFPEVTSNNPRITKAMQQTNSNIDIIISEGERLTDLINDLLDLAKMEAGKIEWKTDQLSLKDIIFRAINSSESLWADKPLTVYTDVQNNLPAVPGDPERIMQVLLNLLSNAVKFTVQGSITCRAKQLNNQVVISVSDTGIGIPADAQAMVFEKFKQIGDTLTEKPQGTGLGLPICKQIIEHHGGDIWVESNPGNGSSFFFTLPLTRPAPLNPDFLDAGSLLQQVKYQVSKASRPADKAKKLLIVAEDPDILHNLTNALTISGFTMCSTSDSQECIRKVKTAMPDIIVIDNVLAKQYNLIQTLREEQGLENVFFFLLSKVPPNKKTS